MGKNNESHWIRSFFPSQEKVLTTFSPRSLTGLINLIITLASLLKYLMRPALILCIALCLLLSRVHGQGAICKTSGVFYGVLSTGSTAYTPPGFKNPPSIEIMSNVDSPCGPTYSKSCCNTQALNNLKSCYNQMLAYYSQNQTTVIQNLRIALDSKASAFLSIASTTSSTASVRRRRRLATDTRYNPQSFLNNFTKLYEYSSRLHDNILEETKKCWNYYYNSIQKGMACSLCSLPEDNKNFNITADSFNVNFDLQTCDLFIPNCLQNIDIMVNLSEFYRNIMISLMQNQFNTADEMKLLDFFMKYYKKTDENNFLDSCKQNASCDNLCKEVLKFGSFDNPYIFGNQKLFRAVTELSKASKMEITDNDLKKRILFDILNLPDDPRANTATEEVLNISLFSQRADSNFSTCLRLPLPQDTTVIENDKALHQYDRAMYMNTFVNKSKSCDINTFITYPDNMPSVFTLGNTFVTCMNNFSGTFILKGLNLASLSSNSKLNSFTSVAHLLRIIIPLFGLLWLI